MKNKMKISVKCSKKELIGIAIATAAINMGIIGLVEITAKASANAGLHAAVDMLKEV